MKIKHIIYLDHAAATPLDPQVKKVMEPFLNEQYGNPSALYSLGRSAKTALDDARENVAKILQCKASEIIFTSSGTESDNLAIFGITRYNSPQPPLILRGGDKTISPLRLRGDRGVMNSRGHIITTNIEHHAVLRPCQVLEKEGYAITYLKVDRDGLIAPEQLSAAIQPNTILISIMYANNEIGVIEPIAELAAALQKKKKQMGRGAGDPPFFHTDGCQCPGYLDINVKHLGVDLMTINGSKIYGPKGTGALYVRQGLRLAPIIYGGGQENGIRPGTENVAGIVGLANALEIVASKRDSESARLQTLRDKLISGIMERIPKAVLNGHPTKRLPNNVNISIPGISGEAMLFYLDEQGVCASVGSACNSQKCEPSHVVAALGRSRNFADSSIRFTLGRDTTEADIDYVIKVLPEIVGKLKSGT